MPGKMITRVPDLLRETGARPMDLVRAGISQNTAYSLARGYVGKSTDNDVMIVLCDFFSAKTGRRIEVGDIQVYLREGEGEE